jgi:hypothetical protein
MGDLIMENSKIEEAKQRLFLAMKNHSRTKSYLNKANANYDLAKMELTEAECELWSLVAEKDQ